ncbi:hypothetical protein K5962_28335, partial [Klebsiella pneumoniae]|uniref:hypothetical protein n=1 Tax=Klebsiella pneumoniae TaxID=573 RepID=UPI001C8C2D91
NSPNGAHFCRTFYTRISVRKTDMLAQGKKSVVAGGSGMQKPRRAHIPYIHERNAPAVQYSTNPHTPRIS